VRYSGAERVVTVDKGEALFDVTHDSKRRFRVAAGDGQIVAVGTRFDVYRRRDTVVVTTLDGTVVVFTGEPVAAVGTGLPDQAMRVAAGYRSEIAGGEWSQPVLTDAQAAVAWADRQILFQARPLGEVAEEFNRYNSTQIEIDDPELRSLPISGRFDAYDVDSFATFLETLDGVAVERTPNRIRVFKPSSERH
jgi:transmembrane sensor